MSTSKRGRSMRSKVERRMQKESGKTMREIRRAKKIKKKLMTDEERLIYNLKRSQLFFAYIVLLGNAVVYKLAKKKVALLLQKLKKYELPELPPSVHDPELFTPEQLQAYKKIGFRNKNYVPVGVRGVFGGVVQNMHLHWKFHETVQVCCDNFPKEKIKEMATMIARLSGGIVINIHNVKTIIMFRGRNYRQPKNLIPFNTLTKRKYYVLVIQDIELNSMKKFHPALFKARFEQALESQKLNIKKIEQQLRRMGTNPEDPVAMASIQRVASTFFNAIDQKEGSPYVFRGEREVSVVEPGKRIEESEPPVDSDQEELDKFIAEIEDAADKEWAEEEEAEKEELTRIRYWDREEIGGRFRRSENFRNSDMDDISRRTVGWKDNRAKKRIIDSDDEHDSSDVRNGSDLQSDAYDSDEAHDEFNRSRVERRKQEKFGRAREYEGRKRNVEADFSRKMTNEDSESENMFSDVENAMWKSESEEEHDSRASRAEANHNYMSSSDDEDEFYATVGNKKNGMNEFESEADSSEAHNKVNNRLNKTQKEADEAWDSD
ncbi:hypothetical protein WN944_009918 [Citrus x changshan-huyou]|uniref:CRM domain-containing protein n=1 Tax=Citrus x changshan-huyou TaxID=2935761 RepID=A0AAP0MW71_9ROSI